MIWLAVAAFLLAAACLSPFPLLIGIGLYRRQYSDARTYVPAWHYAAALAAITVAALILDRLFS